MAACKRPKENRITSLYRKTFFISFFKGEGVFHQRTHTFIGSLGAMELQELTIICVGLAVV